MKPDTLRLTHGDALPTLGNWSEGRANNLDALRLVGAILVIFAHAFPLTGLPNVRVPFYTGTWGTVGVNLFFTISGFLISRSYLRSRRPGAFLRARVLRLFPALIVVTGVLVLLLGPVLTTLPVSDYFSHPWTHSYPRGALSLYEVTRFTVLPGVFMDNPLVQTNGPLWTLQYEWTFYLVVLAMGMAGLLEKPAIMGGLFAVSLTLSFFQVGGDSNLYWTPVRFIFPFFAFFSFGALAYLLRSRIPMTNALALAASGALALGSWAGGLSDALLVIPFGYLVLFVGLNPKIHLSWLTKTGDYSYGLYVWAYPVQQTIVGAFGRDANVWLQLSASLATAFALAILSWHLVEKRALRLKVSSRSLQAGQATPALTPPARTPSLSLAIGGLGMVALFGLAVACRPAGETAPRPSGDVLKSSTWQPLEAQTVDESNRQNFQAAFVATYGFRLFAQAGMAAYPLNAPAGEIRVRVKAAGILGGGRYPQLTVELAQNNADKAAAAFSQVVGRQTLTLTADPREYDVTFTSATSEQLQLRLVFDDDFSAPSEGDRNVMIYSVTATAVP